MRKSVTLLLLTLALGAGIPSAADWPTWRGEGYQGASGETGLISAWSPEGDNLIWKAEFIGRSTPVVFDGRACVIGRVGEGIERQEVVACYDAKDGDKLWEDRFNVYNTTVPFNRVGWASLVADPETGYVYAHGVAGQLHAYDSEGKIVWSRFLAEEFGRLSGYGGRTQTGLVDGHQLILTYVSSGWGLHAAPRHRYFSFDKRTGEVLWISTPGGMFKDANTQSAPVVAEIGGRRLLIAGNADGWIYAVKVGTGEKVWGFHLSKRGINSTVLVSGHRVFASHSEENLDAPTQGRLVCIDGRGKGDVTATHELWRIDELAAGFPSPAYHDGTLYVVDNSANLMAVDAAGGAILWEHSIGTVGKGSPVYADGKLYVTETNGRFHILEPGKDGAKSLDVDELKSDGDRYAEIYGSPAIAYGRIYFATEGGLYCIGDAKKKFKAPRGKRPAYRPEAGEGAPASVVVVPAEVLATPGTPLTFEAHAFDARGRPLGKQDAEWSLVGVSGEISGDGELRVAAGAPAMAGMVQAKLGELSGAARVRLVPDLPWNQDFESLAPGKLPPHWIGAARKFEVQDRDGQKVLAKLFREKGLLRNALYMGPSTLRGYTIESDVMGGQIKRRRSDIGVINGGYTLDLMGNHQRVQVRTWASEERMAQEVDFPWEMGVWYRMKLRVDVRDEKALIRGKVWKKSEAEPEAWTITVEDPLPIESGSPGLVGYSPTDIYYDNIRVTVNQ